MYQHPDSKQVWMNETAQNASPIEAALSDLQKNIMELEECLEKLRYRVSSVMGPVPPQPVNTSEGMPIPTRSTAWRSINSASDRITSINAEIRELTSRLET